MSISVAEVRLWIRDVLLLETQYPEFKPQFDNLRNFLKDIRNLETSDKSGLLELAEKYITDKENMQMIPRRLSRLLEILRNGVLRL